MEAIRDPQPLVFIVQAVLIAWFAASRTAWKYEAKAAQAKLAEGVPEEHLPTREDCHEQPG